MEVDLEVSYAQSMPSVAQSPAPCGSRYKPSAPSLALCLPVPYRVSHHDDNRLNL